MLRLSPPDTFDFSNPLDWPDWKQNFLRFRLAKKLHKEGDGVQVTALIYTMRREDEEKCRGRANLSVWWPGIFKEIKSKDQLCHFYQENQSSQRKEPLMATVLPDRPWQKMPTDLFELTGQKYLVVMGNYSRFIEILTLVKTTSQTVIQKLKSVFARWTVQEIVSNNGTQFKSALFDEFKVKYGFQNTTSIPHHQQANGAAESAVRVSKHILKQEDPFLALMAYRATPIPATSSSQLCLTNLK